MNKEQEAYIQYVNANVGKQRTRAEILKGVEQILGYDLKGLYPCDFAEPEVSKPRSKNRVELFGRIERGIYIVLGACPQDRTYKLNTNEPFRSHGIAKPLKERRRYTD